MPTRSSRPLTTKERAQLQPGRTQSAGDAFLAGMMVFGAVMLGYAILGRVIPEVRQFDRHAWGVLVLVAPGLYVGLRMYRKTTRFAAANPDLAAGAAEVTSYEAKRAVEIGEQEDEGPAFYLELADGRVLFLQGQYLLDHKETATFPCTRFTISRAVHSRTVLALVCEGDPLPPLFLRPPFTPEDYRTEQVPDDGAELDGPFERFIQGRGAAQVGYMLDLR